MRLISTMRKILLGGGVLLIAAAAAFYYFGLRKEPLPPRPDIPFAALEDTSLKDPDNPSRVFRVDFARVEHDVPLSHADLAKLTPANLKAMSQEEIDQIYARLKAGPIPDGVLRGDLFFERGEDGLRTRLAEILGGGLGKGADAKIAGLEKLGKGLWKGKRFYRDERVLRNVIEDFAPLKALIDDESRIEKIEIARTGLLSWISPRTTAWLLFPAKLYCGQSLLDGRRESIIIDYAYSHDLPGYMDRPDALAGRGGLAIRDEIRMVRPGFYLGRAYANRIFLLNFTVYDPEKMSDGLQAFLDGRAVEEDCWAGEPSEVAAQ
ncbi:hypothetical protein [Taklimakanibacter lacteus]|uniref:hypothetical protein n=1 Tax=Taklimakanibacter lacteus TaxID=2268456 RepID=UPI000E65FF4C